MNNKIIKLDTSLLSVFLLNVFFTFFFSNFFLEKTTVNTLAILGIGALVGTLILRLYLSIKEKIKQNIFSSLKYWFSPVTASTYSSLLIILSLGISSFLLQHTTLFIQSNLLLDIHPVIISLLIISCCSYLAHLGMETIKTCSIIFMIFYFFIYLISFLCLLPYLKPINLYPLVLDISFDNLIYRGSVFALTTCAPLFFLLTDSTSVSKKEKKQRKIYWLSLLFIITKTLFILSILSIRYTTILEYPEVAILKNITLLNFVERIEEHLLGPILLNCFLTISVILRYILTYFETCKITLSTKKISFLISILIFSISYFISEFLDNAILIILFLFFLLHLFISMYMKKET